MPKPAAGGDAPLMIPISAIRQETPNVRTFEFVHQLGSAPGQFVMLWLPGVDQKPFSIGADYGDRFELTIFALGSATQALFELKAGDRLGVSGPYGSYYRFEPKSQVITVGGGYGAAPLGFLTDRAVAQNCQVDFLVGARSRENLLFEKRAKRAGADVQVATDDGSRGHQGYVTELLDRRLDELTRKRQRRPVKVFACGPELMQKRVAELAKQYGVPSEISIERYMKCGFGICGNCCVDDTGQTTCQKGPVISGAAALRLSEFGVYHRDKMGLRHHF